MTSATPRHSVSIAAAVVDDDGRVLVTQRRDNAHWEPPGGVLELAETIIDGLRREVHEETGLQIEPDALTGVYKNLNRGIVALVFRCHVTGGQLTTTEEGSAHRWATPDEIRQLATEAYAVRLLDALDYSGVSAIRAHDGTNLL